MKKFTNEHVLANQKRMMTSIIIGVLLFVLAGILFVTGTKEEAKEKENIKDLNTIIMGDDKKEDQQAYLNVQAIPYKFAVYDNTTDSYYILMDDKYLYVAYMSESDYRALNDESIYDKPIKITGVTKATTMDIKKLAIEAYNDSVDDKDAKITLADYNNYFGEVHLDTTIKETTTTVMFYILGAFFSFMGFIILLTVVAQKLTFNRNIKKYDEETIQALDDEMNSSEAFYYSKIKLYLTKNYIINLAGVFKTFAYDDILWMYPYEHRVNGVRVSKGIKVLMNDAKTYLIVNMSVSTRKSKEIYEEIWNTILSKNKEIVTGYTRDNIKYFNQKIKEIKKNKKNKTEEL